MNITAREKTEISGDVLGTPVIQLYISRVKTELMNATKTHTTHTQLHHFTKH